MILRKWQLRKFAEIVSRPMLVSEHHDVQEPVIFLVAAKRPYGVLTIRERVRSLFLDLINAWPEIIKCVTAVRLRLSQLVYRRILFGYAGQSDQYTCNSALACTLHPIIVRIFEDGPAK